MATKEFIAAIELGSSKLSGIAGLKNADGSMEAMACACENAAPFVRKGVIYNIDKAAQAIRAVMKSMEDQLGCAIAKVYVGIGGQSLRTVRNMVSRTLKEEGVVSQELVDSICDENLQNPPADMCILDVAPQEYRIDNCLQTDPVGATGTRVVGQFLNIVARSSLRKNMEMSFEQAGVDIADLLISPLALGQAVLTDSEMRSGCALVDFGAQTTTVAVYKNKLLRHLSVIPLGGNNITRDIATLQIEEEEAERLKTEYGDARYEQDDEDAEAGVQPPVCRLEDGRTVELARLNAIVGARVEEILDNVWNQLQLSGYETQLYAGVVFTGGGSNLKSLEEAFRKIQDKVSKIKTVRFVHAHVSGCESQLHTDGTRNTLLGLLAAGTDNCCKEPEPEPEIQPQPAAAEKPETGLEETGQPETSQPQPEIQPQPEPEPEPKPDPEPVKPKKPKQKKPKWKTFFDSFTEDIFNEE